MASVDRSHGDHDWHGAGSVMYRLAAATAAPLRHPHPLLHSLLACCPNLGFGLRFGLVLELGVGLGGGLAVVAAWIKRIDPISIACGDVDVALVLDQ